jgi:solute carrier family 25 folate transporter 32
MAATSTSGSSIESSSNGSSSSTTTAKLPRKKSFWPTPPPPQQPRDIVHTLSTLTAGVGSGALASMICAPLDLVRTRMQVWGDVFGGQKQSVIKMMSDIIKQDGWQGCFRGLGATLVTVPLFWGVYFPLYDETKFLVRQNYPQLNLEHPSLVHCGSAVFTGAVADVICNPLFVVRTRLQTQALHNLHDGISGKTGMYKTAMELYQTNGPTIFWRGMSANLMGLSHVAVQFPAYEHLKSLARDRRRRLGENHGRETALDLLLASGVAKMGASLLTYPHEVLRSRMMDSRSSIAPTLRGTAMKIYQREGIRGFYTGLPITLIRVVPNCCITFLSYELLLRWSQEQIRARRASTVEVLPDITHNTNVTTTTTVASRR